MSEVEIVAIDKDNGNHENPHEAIRRFQWKSHTNDNGGVSTLAQMVKYLDDKNDAYVERVSPRAYCFVNVSRTGTRFLETYPDATAGNNLLKLPEIQD